MQHTIVCHRRAPYVESDKTDMLRNDAFQSVGSLNLQDGVVLEFAPKNPGETTSRQRMAVDDDYGRIFVSKAVLFGRKRDSQSLTRYCRPKTFKPIRQI